MKFKLKIFIPQNHLLKEIELDAVSIQDANEIGNQIFNEEFAQSGKKNGNYFIEQID